MGCAVIQFPGSNCDQDCLHAVRTLTGRPGTVVWHQDTALPVGTDLVILPGGFSYGDYLRAGAIGARSPIMAAVGRFARDGGFVLGICNGFQILTEAGLLPGALLRNRNLQFVCRSVHLRMERTDTPFTRAYAVRASGTPPVVRMPIAHMDGCYHADAATLARLRNNGQIIFRYCDAHGEVTAAANPNGACDGIAGVCNEAGNVLGLMPHPERVVESALGGEDGRGIFQSVRQ